MTDERWKFSGRLNTDFLPGPLSSPLTHDELTLTQETYDMLTTPSIIQTFADQAAALIDAEAAKHAGGHDASALSRAVFNVAKVLVLQRAREFNPWTPISEAPRDGTRIVAASDDATFAIDDSEIVYWTDHRPEGGWCNGDVTYDADDFTHFHHLLPRPTTITATAVGSGKE